MLQLIIGIVCLLAVFLLRDESTPQRQWKQPVWDPMVILALEELDEEDD